MNTKPPTLALALKYFLICAVLMAAVFFTIIGTGPGKWRETEASAISTSIRSVRDGGPPQWALEVTFSHNVDGHQYDGGRLKVFSHDDRPETAARREQWPAGHKFRIFTDPRDPSNYSLAEDGGREGLAVIASLAVPLLVFIVWLLAYFATRRTPKE